MFVVALLLVLLSWITFWFFEKKHQFKCLKHVPGPVGYPIIGNALEFGRNSSDIYHAMKRIPNEYGPIVKLWLGPRKCCLLVTDPEFIALILSSSKHITKSNDYELLRVWFSNGLLLSTGNYWRQRRKLLTPAFHFKVLEEFVPLFLRNANILLKRLETHVDKDDFDVYPYVENFTLDTICETVMGISTDAQTNANKEFHEAVRTLTNLLALKKFSPWKGILYLLTSDYRQQQKCLNIVHSYTRKVVRDRQIILENKTKQNGIQNDRKKRDVALIDMLLEAQIDGKPLTSDEIKQEVDTFMFAGHDTTASTLSYACYELSKNPHVQDQIVEEFTHLFGNNKNHEVTLSDLKQMKYMEAVIKEVLRLYPAVPYFSRIIKEDEEYKGLRIPKGVQILMPVVSLHDQGFPNPRLFQPERFLHGNPSKHVYGFIPFSAGPRSCLGQFYAMLELKVALYKILSNFQLLPAGKEHEVIPITTLTLKSANGIHIKLKYRHTN